MKVIALARWTLWPDARRPTYLLFETNWSGSDQTYIPDFGRIMPLQWRGIWGATTRVSRRAAHDRAGGVGRRDRRRRRPRLDRLRAGGVDPGDRAGAGARAPRSRASRADTEGASATEFDRRWRDLVLTVHAVCRLRSDESGGDHHAGRRGPRRGRSRRFLSYAAARPAAHRRRPRPPPSPRRSPECYPRPTSRGLSSSNSRAGHTCSSPAASMVHRVTICSALAATPAAQGIWSHCQLDRRRRAPDRGRARALPG